MAIIQGPLFYYFTTGFFKMIFLVPFGLTGLILTVCLLVGVLKYQSSNTKYHILGLILAFTVGIGTIRGDGVEYLDFKFRMAERSKIVEDVKKGILKPNSPLNNGICELPGREVFPISNGGNAIWVEENQAGITSIDFYIDRGFLDHYSAFLYTNNPTEMANLEKAITMKGNHVVKKIDRNWYRVAY